MGTKSRESIYGASVRASAERAGKPGRRPTSLLAWHGISACLASRDRHKTAAALLDATAKAWSAEAPTHIAPLGPVVSCSFRATIARSGIAAHACRSRIAEYTDGVARTRHHAGRRRNPAQRTAPLKAARYHAREAICLAAMREKAAAGVEASATALILAGQQSPRLSEI
jgi:hypothetical protein